ncbi:hypothetical protein FACS1894164_12210 [Spirochaetia bacterium]|nr:hypothetical protein FACS1894164_12210 [Spirochaetia bacterium]
MDINQIVTIGGSVIVSVFSAYMMIRERIIKLEVSDNDQKEKLKRLEESGSPVVKSLSERVENITSQQSEYKAQITNLNEQMIQIKEKLNALAQIKEDVQCLRLSFNASLERVHDRLDELCANRSIRNRKKSTTR